MSFIYLLLLVSPVFASVPLESFENKLHIDFQKRISSIPLRIDELSSKNEKSSYQLQRFDLDLSVSSEFGILVFSNEIEKALELVWERKEQNNLSDVETEEVNIGVSANETAQQMLPHVIRVLSDLNATNRVRKRVIKKVYKDAQKLTKYVKALQSFNGKESWYVANYFKNYYFSASGKVLGNGVKYDKRLRFRFRTLTPAVIPSISKNYEKRIHKRLSRMARHFLAVQALDLPHHRFEMNRVRAVDGFSGNINFGFGEVSTGKGILLEWLPTNNSHFISKFLPTYLPGYLRGLTNIIESSVPDTKNFKLSQIRIKGSIENELSFLFFSLSKSREIEYHYRLK